jgi:hypothetical protein
VWWKKVALGRVFFKYFVTTGKSHSISRSASQNHPIIEITNSEEQKNAAKDTAITSFRS